MLIVTRDFPRRQFLGQPLIGRPFSQPPIRLSVRNQRRTDDTLDRAPQEAQTTTARVGRRQMPKEEMSAEDMGQLLSRQQVAEATGQGEEHSNLTQTSPSAGS